MFTVAMIGAAALLAACSSTSGGGSSTTSTSTTSAAPSTSTQAPGPENNLETTPPTSSATEMSACADGQLVVSAQSMGAAMMHRGLRLTFALAPNTGVTACTLSGYPGVDTGTGGPVVHARRTPGSNGADPSQVVVVKTGAPAHAVVEASAMGPNGTECTNYSTLQITPPNVFQAQTLNFDLPGCELQVHPVTH